MVLECRNWDPGKIVKLTEQGGSVIKSLSCDTHEEADTRLIAHITYAMSEDGSKKAIFQEIKQMSFCFVYIMFQD